MRRLVLTLAALLLSAALAQGTGVSATLGGGRVRALDELMERGQGAGRN